MISKLLDSVFVFFIIILFFKCRELYSLKAAGRGRYFPTRVVGDLNEGHGKIPRLSTGVDFLLFIQKQIKKSGRDIILLTKVGLVIFIVGVRRPAVGRAGVMKENPPTIKRRKNGSQQRK